MQTKEQALAKLNKSKFRSSFYLTKAEKAYLEEKGMETIHRHAMDLCLCSIYEYPEKRYVSIGDFKAYSGISTILA